MTEDGLYGWQAARQEDDARNGWMLEKSGKRPTILKGRILSEQDISTKFIVPMLEALNWDPYKITVTGQRAWPQVHERGFRERDIEGDVWEKVSHGLPDFVLTGSYSRVPFFVEVKNPSDGALNIEKDLPKYKDKHLILLTSFQETYLVVVGSRNAKYKCNSFTSTSPALYIEEFDNLWQHVSNTKTADGTRRAIKATRPGARAFSPS